MAVNLTQAQLSAALRLGDSAEEVAEATRLLAYVTEAISRHLGDAYATAPDAIVEEAAIRLAGYAFDAPNAGRGLSYANAGRNSGAWAILLPFRVHRAGSTGDAVAAAQEAVGTTSNPVINVAVVGADLVITFDDGTTRTDNLPAGMGGGADQTARDAAADAQVTADGAQSDLDAHEATTHNFDATARDAAANARTTAEQAQADLDAHESSIHNTDQTARAAAASARGAIADHERAPHNTDGAARTAAAAAQDRADNAFALADEKVDANGAATAAREITSDWAESDNPDPIPAPKLVNVVNAHEDIVNVLDGRLPGLPVAMRLGWSQREEFIAADFARPSPPIGGSVAGLSDGLAAPPFPPGLASDPTLYLGIWLAGDPDVVEISGGGAQFGDARPLTLDAGKAGVYVVSTARLRPLEGTIFSVTITGPRIVTESDLAAHTSDPDAHHTPPAGGGEGAGLEVSTAEIRFLRSTPIVEIDSQGFTNAAWSNLQRDGADVVCPTTGQIEFFMHSKSGMRDNSVAYAKIPASELRATPSGGEMQVALGANRWFGIRTNSLADQHIQLKGQDGQTSVNGNYSVLMNHIEEVTATFVTQVTSGGGGV